MIIGEAKNIRVLSTGRESSYSFGKEGTDRPDFVPVWVVLSERLEGSGERTYNCAV